MSDDITKTHTALLTNFTIILTDVLHGNVVRIAGDRDAARRVLKQTRFASFSGTVLLVLPAD